MNKEELIGKLHMIYAGDRNALEEMIGYYDGLKQGIEIVQQENQKYKEIIDRAIEYLEQPYRDNFDYSKSQILEILKKAE